MHLKVKLGTDKVDLVLFTTKGGIGNVHAIKCHTSFPLLISTIHQEVLLCKLP